MSTQRVLRSGASECRQRTDVPLVNELHFQVERYELLRLCALQSASCTTHLMDIQNLTFTSVVTINVFQIRTEVNLSKKYK